MRKSDARNPQAVALRRTLNEDAVFGGLSNVASSTGASVEVSRARCI